jgi:hypothetical protein
MDVDHGLKFQPAHTGRKPYVFENRLGKWCLLSPPLIEFDLKTNAGLVVLWTNCYVHQEQILLNFTANDIIFANFPSKLQETSHQY